MTQEESRYSTAAVSLNDLVARDKTLTIFIDAYRQFPELVNLLEDAREHVTVVAVTNEAFKALGRIPPIDELKRRIKRHFLVDAASATDVLHGTQCTVNTLSTQPVSIALHADGRIHTLEGMATTFIAATSSAALYKVDLLLDA
ncbi:hypothetical protein SYNPS1DRAFT_29934 [Syncephalis pseudoplumigaleata]|uniref:FAS1 domain-containing protein n=1 Tax=Syncephalis pseudoplumigaleata TaxID=1712513 RepID=A0A4P9YXP3_9FUNG|nr:hypothetical protein SYNPS1DRAFT_29934 [Syncephalis pseudoplumigaleata]|eukprot:RKP24302.1 hypothetical protein SYNPS1DRAFT_29934 [Syncephalis pseudoplumigaleata]